MAGILALQRSAGNKAAAVAVMAVNRPEPEAVPVQRSAIVLHDYRTYKSPGETALAAARYVVGPGVNVNHDFHEKYEDTTGLTARPDRVVAYLDTPASSLGRKGVPKEDQTKVGHIGNLEDVLRGYGRADGAAAADDKYEGGHLFGYQFNNGLGWDLINRAANLAPQHRESNQNRATTNWGREEAAVATYLATGGRVLYEASVEYPDRTYTVGARDLARLFTGPTQQALVQAGGPNLFTFNTWVPSQFRIDWTKLGREQDMGLVRAGAHVLGGAYHLLWNLSVSRLVGFLGRLSALAGFGKPAGHIFGGTVMDSQRKPRRDTLHELKQLLLDIVKLSVPIGGIFVSLGVTAADVLALVPSTFVADQLARFLPESSWAQVPLAALLVYCLAHWTNVGRLLPNARWAQWIKRTLEAVGL